MKIIATLAVLALAVPAMAQNSVDVCQRTPRAFGCLPSVYAPTLDMVLPLSAAGVDRSISLRQIQTLLGGGGGGGGGVSTANPVFTGSLALSGATTAGVPSLSVSVPNGSFAPMARFNHAGLAGIPTAAVYDAVNYPHGFVFNQTRIAADNLSPAADMAGRQVVMGQSVEYLFGGGATTGARIAQAAFATLQAPMNAADPNSYIVAHWAFVKANVNNLGTLGTSKGSLSASNPQAQLAPGATFYTIIQAMEADTEVDAGASVQYKYGINSTTIGSDAVHGSVREAAFHIGAVPSSGGWTMGIQFSDFSGGGVPISSSGTLIGTAGTVGTVSRGIDWTAFTFTGPVLATRTVNLGGDAVNGSLAVGDGAAGHTPYMDFTGNGSGNVRLISDAVNRLSIITGAGTLATFTGGGITSNVALAGGISTGALASLASLAVTGNISVSLPVCGAAGLTTGMLCKTGSNVVQVTP